MSNNKKKVWGTRSAWAMSFFDMVPPTENATLVSSSPSSSSPLTSTTADGPSAQKAAKLDKLRKRQEIDPQTRWRCRRCHALLLPPIDAATQKPRYGVMMSEHLEGISSGGTTHLTTGVCVCAAGTLRYDKNSRDTEQSGEATATSPASCSLQTKVTASTPMKANAGADDNSVELACAAVRDLLHNCQRAALADSEVVSGARGPLQQPCRRRRRPAPLVFVVVENPKTPANAGGILRAMKCYGICGPSPPTTATQPEAPKKAPMSAVEEEKKSENDSALVQEAAVGEERDAVLQGEEDVADGVLQRVGAFIFSGTRLQKAMTHTDFAGTLRTDPTHASRDIPQLCVPSLDALFRVLKEEYGHHQPPSSSRAAVESPVRVVAVELVEGATLLPAFAHPFSHTDSHLSEKADELDEHHVTVPMVFYVFGAEDGTLSAHHVEHDVDEVVFMPTTGSMNLAATVNVLLYDRIAKECCGLLPAVTAEEAASSTVSGEASGVERHAGQKWRRVFETRNANNRTRWTRPTLD